MIGGIPFRLVGIKENKDAAEAYRFRFEQILFRRGIAKELRVRPINEGSSYGVYMEV